MRIIWMSGGYDVFCQVDVYAYPINEMLLWFDLL